MTKITLIGYGNQGRAWAHNLRDSGWTVTVSGRPESKGGQGLARAHSEGFSVVQPEKLRESSGLFALLLPDEAIPAFYAEYLAGNSADTGLTRSFFFAHGFSVVHSGLKFSPSDDIILVAPKGIGVKLRENYVAGSGVMGVLGVKQDASREAWAKAREVAKGLGCERVGLLDSSFEEETAADLLSEQAILCGVLPRLVDESVRFLVSKGIDPKLATYECLHELKLIVDMMVSRGIAGMYRDVSNTAKFGGLRAADRLLTKELMQEKLHELWDEIENGTFAKDLKKDVDAGFPWMKKEMGKFSDSPTDKNL